MKILSHILYGMSILGVITLSVRLIRAALAYLDGLDKVGQIVFVLFTIVICSSTFIRIAVDWIDGKPFWRN